jgi:hypothetical protein
MPQPQKPEKTAAQKIEELRRTNPEQFERVRLVGNDDEYFVFDAPGSGVSAYGHKWTVMEGQYLETDMHRDFVDAEIAAGRIIRVKEKALDPEAEAKRQAEIDEQKKDPKMQAGADPSEVDDDGFSMDSETVFGVGSIDLLKVRLEKLKPKSKIADFVAKRFNIKLSDRQPKPDLIQEAIEIVQTALGE